YDASRARASLLRATAAGSSCGYRNDLRGPTRRVRGDNPTEDANARTFATQRAIPIRIRLGWLVSLGGAILTDDQARPPLRNVEPFAQHVHGPTSPRRAHQFPRAISRNATFSSSLSATMRF